MEEVKSNNPKWIEVLKNAESIKRLDLIRNGGNVWKREHIIFQEKQIKVSLSAVMNELVRSKKRNHQKRNYSSSECGMIINAIGGYLLRMNRTVTLALTILIWNVFNTGTPPIQVIIQHNVLPKLISITGRRGASIIQYAYVLKIIDRVLDCYDELRDYIINIGTIEWIWWIYFKSQQTITVKIQKNATLLLKNMNDLNKPEINGEPIPMLIQFVVKQFGLGDYRLKKRTLKILLLIISPEYSRLAVTEGLTIKIGKYLRVHYEELIEQNQYKLVSRILEVISYISCGETFITNQIITRPLLDAISRIVKDNDPLVEGMLFEFLTKISINNPYLISTLREMGILRSVYQNLRLDLYTNTNDVLNLIYVICGYGSNVCIKEIIKNNAIESIALMTYDSKPISLLNSRFILHIISDTFPSTWFNEAPKHLKINVEPHIIIYPEMKINEQILPGYRWEEKSFDNIPSNMLQMIFNMFMDLNSPEELLHLRGVSKCWRFHIDDLCKKKKKLSLKENWLSKDLSKQAQSSYIEKIYRHFPSITSITVANDKLNRNITKAMYFGVDQITELYLNEVEEMRYIDYYLIAFKFENMKILHIVKCPMDQGGFDSITHRLRELKELSLVEVGTEVVFSGISRLYNLESLRLGLNYHRQPDKIMDEIAAGLGDSLKKLVLRLGMIDLIDWNSHMQKFEELTELRLCFVSYRSVDITAIRLVTTLENLELVEFGHAMYMTTLNNCNFIPIVRCCYRLKRLNLGGNHQSMGRYTDKFILDLTMHCRGLRTLCLETASLITDAGIKSLSRLRVLKRLRLKNVSKITDDSIAKLVSLSRSLNTLHLSLTPKINKTFIEEWIAVAIKRPTERFEIRLKEEIPTQIKLVLPRNLRILFE